MNVDAVKEQDGRHLARLERRAAELALVTELLLTLGRSLDSVQIRREVLNVAFALTGATRVRLAVRSKDAWDCTTLARGQEEAAEWHPSALGQMVLDRGEAAALRSDDAGADLSSYLGLPVIHDKAILGVLEVEELPVPDRLDDYAYTLSLVASAASLALANARLLEDVQHAGEVLASERERLAVTLRSIGDGVIATDSEGKVSLLNRVAENLTGWSQEEAFGKAFEEVFQIINENTREPCDNPVARVLEAGTIIGLANHTALISRDGTERSIADSAAPIRDGNEEIIGTVIVFRDITLQKQTEAARRRAEEETEQLRRDFLGVISHELRTPLTVIKMATGRALRIKGKSAGLEKNELLRMIDEYADRLNELVDNLLDVTRIEGSSLTVDPVPIDLREIIKEACITFGQTDQTHEIRTDLPDSRLVVLADPRRVRQVLANLLSNASKFSPEKTIVTVWTENLGKEIATHIQDKGLGIAVDRVPDLFRKFSRVHDTGAHKIAGTGLGLAICKGIVDAHGGRIWASSAGQGLGSTFTFTLPKTPR